MFNKILKVTFEWNVDMNKVVWILIFLLFVLILWKFLLNQELVACPLSLFDENLIMQFLAWLLNQLKVEWFSQFKYQWCCMLYVAAPSASDELASTDAQQSL